MFVLSFCEVPRLQRLFIRDVFTVWACFSIHMGTDAWTVCIKGVNAGGEIKD